MDAKPPLGGGFRRCRREAKGIGTAGHGRDWQIVEAAGDACLVMIRNLLRFHLFILFYFISSADVSSERPVCRQGNRHL